MAESKKDEPVLLLEKPKRPKVLGGITVKVKTGCGNMYVQLNWYHGRLFEIFATLGHGGGCAGSEMEALTRSVTLGLKHGVPIGDYIHQFKGILCPNPVPFPKSDSVMSCPDAIAKILEQYGTIPVSDVLEFIQGANGDIVAVTPEDEKARAMATTQEQARIRAEQGLS